MKKLKKLCEMSGKQQKEIAIELGIAPSTLSQYANGSRHPDVDRILQIADYFNVSLDFLFGREEKKAPDQGLSKIEEDLLKCFRGVSPESQLLICHVAESEYRLHQPSEQGSSFGGRVFDRMQDSLSENQA